MSEKIIQSDHDKDKPSEGATVGEFHPVTGERVLDYWPTNGKWRNPRTGETGTVGAAFVVQLATLCKTQEGER